MRSTWGGVMPFRRNVIWAEARTAPIRPLLEGLSFTKGRKSWGQAFRFGLLRITAADFAAIGAAMGCAPLYIASIGPQMTGLQEA